MSRTIATDVFGTPERKKTINSKEKGNDNERVCCKVLSDWTGEEFARIPRSGGLRWKNTANICGDVLCTNLEYRFLFSVETKHLKDLTVTKKLRENSEIFTLWAQCKRDAGRSSQHPLLMLRKNGMKARTYYIFLPLLLVQEAVDKGLLYCCSRGVTSDGEVILGFKSEDIFAYPYAEFIGLLNL